MHSSTRIAVASSLVTASVNFWAAAKRGLYVPQKVTHVDNGLSMWQSLGFHFNGDNDGILTRVVNSFGTGGFL